MSVDAMTIASTVVEMARTGRFTALVELFAPPLRAAVPAAALQAAWTAETDRTGPVLKIGTAKAEPGANRLTRVRVPVTGERGEFTIILSIDDAGVLHGLRLAAPEEAAWTPPPYADPDAFREREVTIGSGPLAVPGTLSLPRATGPVPGVVLLGGGGPFDRDASTGPNKPLKDLAWGLASRGIAVARHDKVTFTHPHVTGTPDFTAAREYLPSALAAVDLLRAQPEVDPARVFVAGHSMGGKLAPRVAAAGAPVAGLVILAGDTQPMHVAAVRVARHLGAVAPGLVGPDMVEEFTRQAARVADPALAPSAPAGDLLFGFPASYWLDLRGYDPVAIAAAVCRPMLILQGGRDYQVTVADDLAGWRAGLGDRADVTIRVHAAADHLFFPGTGASTPADYLLPHHVDPAVVADIADWVTAQR